jgi:MFS transporter, DHA1 family, multidrug resistance protein
VSGSLARAPAAHAPGQNRDGPDLHPPTILATGGVVGLAVLGDAFLYAVLPSHSAAFGIPVELVGILLGANRLVRLVFNGLAGQLVHRFGVGWPFLAGAGGAVVSTGLLAFLPGFWPLLLVRVLWGACWSLLRLGGYVVVLRWAGPQRGRALGLFWAVVRLGMLLGGFGGALLVDAWDLRTALLVLTGCTLGAPPLAAGLARASATTSDLAEPVPTDGGAPAWWKDRTELAVCASITLHAFAVQGLVFATLGLVLLQRFGGEIPVGAALLGVATLTGALLGAQRVVELVCAPALGHVADRHGRAPIVLAGLATGTLAALVLAVVGDPAAVIAAVLLFWLGGAAALAGLDASAADLAQRRGGARFLARYATWLDGGAAIGPVVGYALAAAIGTGWLYLGVAALLLAAGALYLGSGLAGVERR